MLNVRFKGLSEIINDRISEYASDTKIPYGTPESVIEGQFVYLAQNDSPTGILRWGFSKWGIDPVIGVSLPTDAELYIV